MAEVFFLRVRRLTFVRFVAAFGWVFLLGLFLQSKPVYAESGSENESPTGAIVEDEPLPETEVVKEGDSIKIRSFTSSGNKTYILADEPETPEQKAGLAALSPEARERFEARRIGFLKTSLAVLNRGRFVIGTGVYTKNKVVQVWDHTGAPITKWVGSFFPKKKDGEAPAEEPAAESASPQRTKISELGRDTVQYLMRQINTQLYDHPQVVAESNEFGVNLSLGAVGAVGQGTKGKYINGDLGISIGYNVQRKEAAFEVYASSDSWVNALPGLAMLEARGRVLGYSAVQNPETPMHTKARTTLFPFSSLTDNAESVRAGLSAGFATGLMMPIYVELATNRFTLLRGTAGPRNPFFIGMPKGVIVDGVVGAAKGFDNFTGQVISRAAKWAGSAAARCWAAMTSMGRGGRQS